MASRLADGTVIPSFLGVTSQGRTQDPGTQTNIALRFGEVVDIVYPDDDRNSNGKVNEYVVAVQHKDGRQAGAKVKYNNVQLANLFGGVADVLSYTLRPTPKGQSPQPGQLGVGSKVLLMCINGDKHQAMIIGGLNDNVNNPTPDNSAQGHHLNFEFNGFNVAIADDGSMVATFNGKTDIDGSLDSSANSDAQGSTIAMTADGNITVSSPDMLNQVVWDFANNQLTVTGDQNLNLNCTGPINLTAAGVNLGAANNAMLLASNFRFNQMLMDTEISAYCTTLASLCATAGAAATAAGASNTVAGGLITAASPLLIIPMVGTILAAVPFTGAGAAFTSGGASLSAAGAALTAASPVFAAIGAAIDAFEAQSSTYLSGKNFND